MCTIKVVAEAPSAKHMHFFQRDTTIDKIVQHVSNMGQDILSIDGVEVVGLCVLCDKPVTEHEEVYNNDPDIHRKCAEYYIRKHLNKQRSAKHGFNNKEV